MPDRRNHRGAHPQDRLLFARDAEPDLRRATSDLNWLLTRGYASVSALKLVGDRYALNARQRLAVGRCACSEEDANRRQMYQVETPDLAGAELWIDGYNVLTSLEAALSGGVILLAHDGCFRDMASMHGSYRKVAETIPAIEILGELLAEWNVSSCRWLLDQPVSNSGRLKTMLRELSEERGWNWEIDLVPDPDPVLSAADQIVASADSQILNQAGRWFNLARTAVEERVPEAWVVDLSGC
ncbi:DUF434 domain-containing protein [Gimesia chilikensis]|uniref:DUF434 domain-containing protein n=1 Tax=Gimesia chilikensis TaxID=2605989 RepID=A0A517PGI6_9PLAN|nr:DUF434 domain-containing protein [Gimesia chilikensis]QDT18464.1 hypothetical protein HG66A1_02250 [Gimesia chilikensis]